MKWIWQKLTVLLAGFPLLLPAANIGTPPLPSIETVLKGVKEQAEKEGEQERLFKQQYTYTRTRVTEYRNGDGELTKRDERSATRKTPTTSVQPEIKKISAEKPDTQTD